MAEPGTRAVPYIPLWQYIIYRVRSKRNVGRVSAPDDRHAYSVLGAGFWVSGVFPVADFELTLFLGRLRRPYTPHVWSKPE
jgi:hypothetical protein